MLPNKQNSFGVVNFVPRKYLTWPAFAQHRPTHYSWFAEHFISLYFKIQNVTYAELIHNNNNRKPYLLRDDECPSYKNDSLCDPWDAYFIENLNWLSSSINMDTFFCLNSNKTQKHSHFLTFFYCFKRSLITRHLKQLSIITNWN